MTPDAPSTFASNAAHDAEREAAHGIDVGEVALLDEGWPATMYIAFGLVRAGLRVHVLSTDLVARRVLPREIRATNLPAVTDARFDAALDEAFASGPLPLVVWPLTEQVQGRVSEMPGTAPWRARVWPRFDARQHELLRDKRAMGEFVRQLGEPVPRQRVVTTPHDLDAAIADLGLPIVVKGPSGCGGSDVRIARTAEEAGAARRVISDRLNTALSGDDAVAFAQEFIDGPTYLVGGLFRAGVAVRVWTARRVEVFPPRVGTSTIVRTAAEPELQRSALAIFAALQINGLASADFVQGPDGGFRFLEVNPRPWGSIGAALPGGVDFFGPLAATLRGRDVAIDTPPPRDGQRIGLFPQLLDARSATGGTRAMLAALLDPALWRGIPWRSPRLVGTCLQRVWWSWDEHRRARRPAAPAPAAARASTSG